MRNSNVFKALSGGALMTFALAGLAAPLVGYDLPAILEVAGLLVAIIVGIALVFDAW